MPHSPVAWRAALAVLALVRLAFPVAALIASGSKLPLLPRYEYAEKPRGDAYGYFGTARLFIEAWRQLGDYHLLGTGLLVAAAVALLLWLRLTVWRGWIVVGLTLAVSLACVPAIRNLPKVPAGAIGWPLAWSGPLAPFDLARSTTDHQAFAAGFSVALVAQAATVAAVAYAGLYASGRRSVGLLAAAVYALWPVLSGLIGGHSAAGNDQWAVDVGLHGYSEPLSTALVAGGTALVLSPGLTPPRLATAGLVLSYSVLVRPTNLLIVVVALLFVTLRAGLRRLAPAVAAAAALLPIYFAFEPKKTGYDAVLTDSTGKELFSEDFALYNWRESLLWHPRTLLVLLPPAVLGALVLRSRLAAAFLVSSIAVTAALYTFFFNTAQHPRYLLAALPALLVLLATGLVFAAGWLGRQLGALRNSGWHRPPLRRPAN